MWNRFLLKPSSSAGGKTELIDNGLGLRFVLFSWDNILLNYIYNKIYMSVLAVMCCLASGKVIRFVRRIQPYLCHTSMETCAF